MRNLLPLIFLAAFSASAPCDDQWVYIDNGIIRLGVNRTAGACIGWFSAGKDAPNLLNSHDRGRFVQQSYYGAEDGSLWSEKPWRYNPVQGGDWRGKAAGVVEFSNPPNSLYSRTRPVHWASGADIHEMSMEQWITLEEHLAHVRFRMTYSGEKSHPPHPQEIPAFFVQPSLDTLVLYEGAKPWTNDVLTRRQPAFPNEAARLAEHWAAWVDAEDRGIGLYVPIADEATCYRFGKDRTAAGACSYLAPLKTFPLTPGLVFEYDAWLTIGSIAEIRSRFIALHEKTGDVLQHQVEKQGAR
jgi:hypothetical protein